MAAATMGAKIRRPKPLSCLWMTTSLSSPSGLPWKIQTNPQIKRIKAINTATMTQITSHFMILNTQRKKYFLSFFSVFHFCSMIPLLTIFRRLKRKMAFLGAITGINYLCGIPGASIIVPLLAAINPINPINWIIYIVYLAVLYYVPKVGSVFNTSNGRKSLARAALWALVFYFITAYILYLILIFTVCGTSSVVEKKETIVARAMKE